jgi:hypothetical protein
MIGCLDPVLQAIAEADTGNYRNFQVVQAAVNEFGLCMVARAIHRSEDSLRQLEHEYYVATHRS